MSSCRCFKENCQNKLFAKCDCEENVLFCQEHSFEHLLKPSSNRHQPIRLYFKPAEEIKQPVIQKLRDLKKEIKIYRNEAIFDANEIIRSFNEAFGKYLNQIKEVNKRCSKIIEGLLNEEEFLDIAAETDMESVLKLDIQKAEWKMAGWSTGTCWLDYKEIKAAVNKTYEIPFNPFKTENEVGSNELSFFRHNTSNFTTINLDTFQISSIITLSTQEPIGGPTRSCILPDKTYFFCNNEDTKSGLIFTVDSNKNFKKLQNSKVNAHVDPVFHNNFIYVIGGNNKLAERYDFKQNIWESMAPLPKDLNFSCSSNALYRDKILIASEKITKIIIYNIPQNNYEEVQNLVLNNKYKLILRGSNRIYLLERGGRTLESAEKSISSWTQIGTNDITSCCNRSSVVLYKGIIYFVVSYNELWKFDLTSKQPSKVATI